MVRSAIIVLALVLAVASAGTVLCEMDCAVFGHAASAAAMTDGSYGGATLHCQGEQNEIAHHQMPAPHRTSSGNTKHSGAHLHARIVATATARVQISPVVTFSAVIPVAFGAAICARTDEASWNDSSSPPVNSPSVFASSVLRI
jgi:hypothetical protein